MLTPSTYKVGIDHGSNMEDTVPTFWVGHHEDKRQRRASPELIQQAHTSGVCFALSGFVSV
jgi:hypothetical protein